MAVRVYPQCFDVPIVLVAYCATANGTKTMKKLFFFRDKFPTNKFTNDLGSEDDNVSRDASM